MHGNNNARSCTIQNGEGRLPACAPLAVPFVPFQQEQPQKYEARKGLVRGTLFPGLDLPFMDMVNTGELPDTPLHELQALGFAIQELALYLDTHREDTDALELYRAYQELHRNGLKEYEKTYGPLSHQSTVDSDRFAWLDNPWPWEYTPCPGKRRCQEPQMANTSGMKEA